MFGMNINKPSLSRNSIHSSRESLGITKDSLHLDGSNPLQDGSLHNHSSIQRDRVFLTYYLGAVMMFMMQPNSRFSGEAQLIAKIEEEQGDGKLNLRPTQKDAVRLKLDNHGIQIRREGSDDVILRIPLHTLSQIVMFDDGFGKYNLAAKVIVGKDLFSCHVFQCMSEEVALSICESLQEVFRMIMAQSDGSM